MRPHRTTTPGRTVERYVGVQRVIEVAEPGAGRDWSLVLPSGAYWRLLVGSCELTTSAAEASRTPGMQIENGSVVLWRATGGETIRRELRRRVSYSSAGSPGGEQISGNPVSLEIPELIFSDGFVISSFTELLQREDRYTGINLLFDEIAHGPHGIEPVEPGIHVDIDTIGN